jgi:crotonobetaine/carnitine-CoA ligase
VSSGCLRMMREPCASSHVSPYILCYMSDKRGSASVPPLPPLAERRISDLLIRQAHTRPDSVFITFPVEGSQWTYQELLDGALKLGGGLKGLGLQRGDRVGIMLGNRSEYVLSWFGSLFMGTIDVSINSRLTGSLLRHQLALTGVKAVICDAPSSRAVHEVAADLPSLQTVVSIDPIQDRVGALETITLSSLLAQAPIKPQASAPKDIASIRYTSGTTGPAKAVALTHSRVTAFATQFVWLTEYKSSDRLYTCFPLHHGVASGLGVVSTLVAGGSLVIDAQFSASQYWARIRAHEATLAHILNPMVPILLGQPSSSDDRNHRCTRLWTASPNPSFEARFGSRLIYFYGQSEGGAIAFTPLGEAPRQGSAGRSGPYFEVQICDEDDYPVPAGVAGQILWRPLEPHLMTPGYFGDPEATVRAWQGLWFHSGDQGMLDEDGYLYLIGRMGDQIRRKGVMIASDDVETIALEFSGLAEAAATGVPSELGESDVRLSIVAANSDFDLAAFVEHLKRRLPPEMVPRFVELRDSLPHTDTYKISKTQLRADWTGVLGPNILDLEASRRRSASEQDLIGG